MALVVGTTSTSGTTSTATGTSSIASDIITSTSRVTTTTTTHPQARSIRLPVMELLLKRLSKGLSIE